MRLTLIRKTVLSNETNCPALYRTDAGAYVVVGKRIHDADVVAQITAGVGDDELAVFVPADVLEGSTVA